MSYPTTLPTYIVPDANKTLDEDNHTARHTQEEADIIALAGKLGVGASVASAGTVLRGTGAGASAWGQLDLSTDVAGFSSSNLRTLLSDETGTGVSVFGTSPTISTPNVSNPSISGGGSWSGSPVLSTPAIADFTNALHNHTNTSGGGTLNGANALTSGSIDFARLVTTIFSGQIQTQVNSGTAGGTMNYINLGGIKLLWSVTAGIAGNTGGASYGVAFPASHFTTTPIVVGSLNNAVTTPIQHVYFTGVATTGLNVQIYAASTTGSENVGYLVIGT